MTSLGMARLDALRLGVREKFLTGLAWPDAIIYLTSMSKEGSATTKLKLLLQAVNKIHEGKLSAKTDLVMGADDFLPLFIYVLVQTGLEAVEVEVEFLWGLLAPSLLSGEGGYYLTTLSSAVHVIKGFLLQDPSEDTPSRLEDVQGFS